jgi:hypothetical protein
VDEQSGLKLLLGHPAAAMPSGRARWRAPVEICHEEAAAAAAPACAHARCRNNPACAAPFDQDCTPQVHAVRSHCHFRQERPNMLVDMVQSG